MKSNMKRTQIYLDEEMARTLNTLSRQKGVTISELIRESLREHYMQGKEIDKAGLARSLAGIWENRTDLKNIDSVVRGLRKGSRLKGLANG
jgi:predicted DNA-binding protein